MFSHKSPPPRRQLINAVPVAPEPDHGGILLGGSCRWNPVNLANPHGCIIGGSGAGKTQTLKAIAYSVLNELSCQVVIIDFHGDQDMPGEICYHINMESEHGINPLLINLDRQGGGPNLKAIELAILLRRTMVMGPNQEGLLIELLKECYRLAGITQEDYISWRKPPPSLRDLRDEIEKREQDGDLGAVRLKLKLAALFEYGIFSKSQPVTAPHTRWDLSKLPPALQSIAGDAIALQLMNIHRLLGQNTKDEPRTLLFIDEAKELGASECLDRITADGRKYGLGLWVASQSSRHISKDVLSNTFTKIVLPVDSSELSIVSRAFRFDPQAIADLNPLESLVRFGKEASKVNIYPYYRRCR